MVISNLPLVQDKWSAVYDVRATLVSLRSLLGGADPSPLRTTRTGWTRDEWDRTSRSMCVERCFTCRYLAVPAYN